MNINDSILVLGAGSLIDHDCEISDGTHVKMRTVIRNEMKTSSLSVVEANSVHE